MSKTPEILKKINDLLLNGKEILEGNTSYFYINEFYIDRVLDNFLIGSYKIDKIIVYQTIIAYQTGNFKYTIMYQNNDLQYPSEISEVIYKYLEKKYKNLLELAKKTEIARIKEITNKKEKAKLLENFKLYINEI